MKYHNREARGFLENLEKTFLRRRKTIRMKSSFADLTWKTQAETFSETQFLEIDCGTRIDGKMATIRIQAWEDRWLWIDARMSGSAKKGGWAWAWTIEGRYLAGDKTSAIVEALEASIFEIATRLPSAVPEALSLIFKGLLSADLKRL